MSVNGTKLLKGVEKSYDKGKFLLSESKKLDNLTTAEDYEAKVERADEQSEASEAATRFRVLDDEEVKELGFDKLTKDRKAKEDYDEFVAEYPDVKAVNVEIEDSASVADALKQIHTAL